MGFARHFLCESPYILHKAKRFYAIGPLILWHILGGHLLEIWGVRLSKLFSVVFLFLSLS